MVAAWGVFGLAAILLTPGEGRAAFDVAAGYDLFQTQPGTTFTGLGALTGVPLGTFNFGGSIGVQNVGLTDTILQRTSAVTGSSGSTGTSNLVMNALQLETVAPVNIGAGLNNYFVTLQSVHGGTASMGTISITFGPTGLSGTFSSSIDVFYDIRVGSLTGAIVSSSDLVLSSSGNPWTINPPGGAVTINGVNQFLSGTVGDRSQDFWPDGPTTPGGTGGTLTETEPNGSSHVVAAAQTPEPASVLMLGMGTIGVGIFGWRRRSRAA
jgi:hypothetical protein